MVTITPSDELRALAAGLGERATLLKPLGPLTTYGVGGPAALFVEIDAPSDLEAVRAGLRDGTGGAPLFVIGRGSNLLVADAGFDGVVIRLGPGFGGLELPEPGAETEGGAPVVRPVAPWRCPCWRAGWPTPDGRAWPGRSVCPARSAARSA